MPSTSIRNYFNQFLDSGQLSHDDKEVLQKLSEILKILWGMGYRILPIVVNGVFGFACVENLGTIRVRMIFNKQGKNPSAVHVLKADDSLLQVLELSDFEKTLMDELIKKLLSA